MMKKIIYTIIFLLLAGSAAFGSPQISHRFDSLVNQIFDEKDLMRSVFTYRINYVSDNFLAGMLGNRKLRQTMDLFYKHTGCGVTIRAAMGQGGLYAAIFTPKNNHGITSQNPESDFNFNISLIPLSTGTNCKAVITWSTGFYSSENDEWFIDQNKINRQDYDAFKEYMRDSIILNLPLPYLETVNNYLVNAISLLMGERAALFDARLTLEGTSAVDSFCSQQLLSSGDCEVLQRGSMPVPIKWHSAKKGQDIILKGSMRGDSIDCILKDGTKNIAALTEKDSVFGFPQKASVNEHRYKIATSLLTQAQVNLAVYNEETYNIVLVPIGSVNISTGMIKNELDKIYLPSITKFNVTLNNSMSSYNKDISAENIAPEEVYHSTMNDAIAMFKSNVKTDKKSFYLFLLGIGFKNNSKNVGGYMPYKRQFGFVDASSASDGSQNAMFHKTIAHELAHGIFGLKHTTGNEYGIPYGQNLLDYSESTTLNKFQWDIIHDPYAGLFDMDSTEDAMLQIRSMEWYADALLGFVPDDLEKKIEDKKAILDLVHSGLQQYKKSSVKQPVLRTIYETMRDKKSVNLKLSANLRFVESIKINGEEYDVGIHTFAESPEIAHSNARLTGYNKLKGNTSIKAGNTKDYAFIVFYKGNNPTLLLQIFGQGEAKFLAKEWLNYLLIVDKNSAQEKEDKQLSMGWGFLAENVLTAAKVKELWGAIIVEKPYLPWVKNAISEAKTANGISECAEPLFSKGKEYHKDGGHNNFCPCGTSKHKNYCNPSAWCASFANWCLRKAGTAYTKSAGSQTFLNHTDFVEISEPVFGAIAVFTNLDGNGNFKSSGHVAFVVGKIGNDKILCLGGNQADMIKVSKYSLDQDKKKKEARLFFRGYYIPTAYFDKLKDYRILVETYTDAEIANKQIINLNINSVENESTR